MRPEACMDAGFRAYRYSTDNPRERVMDLASSWSRRCIKDCVLLHKIAGDGKNWAIDFHTELDPPDAINLATMLEPLHLPTSARIPFAARASSPMRPSADAPRVPIAVGEQFGYKWDISTLIEKQLIRPTPA